MDWFQRNFAESIIFDGSMVSDSEFANKNPWAVASSGEEAGAVAKEVLQLGRAPSEAEKVEGT